MSSMAIRRRKRSTGDFPRAFGISLLLVGLFWSRSLPACDAPHVGPGLEYIHHRIGDGPWSIHVVKVDRSRARFRLVSTLAEGHVYGLASVSEQIERLGDAEGRPVAAVNGDFFHIRPGPYQGDPTGLHIAQGEFISSPAGTSFWIDGEGDPHIGPVAARFRATGAQGLNVTFTLNQARAEDAAVLYTPAIGTSTRTGPGLELVLERTGDGDWLPLRAGCSCRARISTLNEQGDVRLAPDIMILSIGPELARQLPSLVLGSVILLDLKTSPDLTGAATALGGGPILLEAGESPDWRSPLPRHPRTALGWSDEHFFMAVVDGRQEHLSVGMTYPELASLMKRLGCTYAMNLDGGGSSTLWLDGRIMNSPSDGRERRLANSLIVVSAVPNENEEDLRN